MDFAGFMCLCVYVFMWASLCFFMCLWDFGRHPKKRKLYIPLSKAHNQTALAEGKKKKKNIEKIVSTPQS